MALFDAIKYVGSGLTLIAFIVAALTYAYQQKLKSREKKLLAVPAKDRLAAASDAAEYIRIDLAKIPPNDRAKIVLEQLALKAQQQRQYFIGFMFLALLIGIGTIVATMSLPPTKPLIGEGARSGGWAYVGYLDKSKKVWAVGPFVNIASYSGSPDRTYPIRIGDVVRPRKNLPQVIVGYASTGTANDQKAPPSLTNTIDPKRDYTGSLYLSTNTYLVNDVQVWSNPDADSVVWLSLTSGDPDPERTQPPKAEDPPKPPSTTTTVTYQVCTGEYERNCGGPHSAYLYCDVSVEAWAAKQCQSLAGEVQAVAKVSVHGGNKCGYGMFTVICSVTK
ncbi:hypothetical protein [Mesorhizobium sp. M0006]|uniref:hypothetical protein n=1 Tax=unclassified Mesorhizobium TaxID=325217 RepID=UPI00333BF94E